MKCRYCGQEIPKGMLYCENCGNEVRIVPDYNPLDDMLTAQIRGSIDGQGYEDYLDYDSSEMNTEYMSARRNTARTANRRTTGRMNTGRQMPSREQRRRQAERKRELRKREEEW